MTEAEINLAIAKIEYPDDEFEIQAHCSDVFSEHWADTFNYCNDWEDIGPIIAREGINVYRWRNHWTAVCPNENHHIFSETPMKAAALCFLKMRESE